MGTLVFYQMVFFHKTFITLTALVGLLRRAGTPVRFQNSYLLKVFTALSALIRLFINVGKLMF